MKFYTYYSIYTLGYIIANSQLKMYSRLILS